MRGCSIRCRPARADRRRGRVHGQRHCADVLVHQQLRQDHPRMCSGLPCASTSRQSSSVVGRWRPARRRPSKAWSTPSLDLIDAMIAASNDDVTDEQLDTIERSACPTCGSCSGMFTANSMNCLTEAIGLSLPGNGSRRWRLMPLRRTSSCALEPWPSVGQAATTTGTTIGPAAQHRDPRLPQCGRPRCRHGRLDQHRAPPAGRGPRGGPRLLDRRHRRHFTSGAVPVQGGPEQPALPHGGRSPAPGGIPALLGELDRAGLLERSVHAVHSPSLTEWLGSGTFGWGSASDAAYELFHAAPGGVRTTEPFSTTNRWVSLDTDAAEGCIRDREHAYTIDGGLAVPTATSPGWLRRQDRRCA